jgi:hypothetical protein
MIQKQASAHYGKSLIHYNTLYASQAGTVAAAGTEASHTTWRKLLNAAV